MRIQKKNNTQWLEAVKESKVESPAEEIRVLVLILKIASAPVDEDTPAGDAEAAIQSQQPVSLDRLDVDVHHPRELTLT